jgi:hypothetical protein
VFLRNVDCSLPNYTASVLKQHNYVLTVLFEGSEEDLGLLGEREREREEVTRGWTER